MLSGCKYYQRLLNLSDTFPTEVGITKPKLLMNLKYQLFNYIWPQM
jgi:hypothetical protein